MNNQKITESLKNQLDATCNMFAVMGISTNIQVYFLTEYESKKALTKNLLFRSQGDESLPSSPKKYDYLDSLNPLQIALAVNERKTKYKHLENYDRNPKQGFVVASPIISSHHGIIGSLCFTGGVDPILNSKISFENFKSISEALARSLASTIDLFSEEELLEISR